MHNNQEKLITHHLSDIAKKIKEFQDATSELCLPENRTSKKLKNCQVTTLELIYLLRQFLKLNIF